MADIHDLPKPGKVTDDQSEISESTPGQLINSVRAAQLEAQISKSDPALCRELKGTKLGFERVCLEVTNLEQARQFSQLRQSAKESAKAGSGLPSSAEELYMLRLAKNPTTSLAEKQSTFERHEYLFEEALEHPKEIRAQRGYQANSGESTQVREYKDFEFLREKYAGLDSDIEKAFGKQLGSGYRTLLGDILFKQWQASGFKTNTGMEQLLPQGFDANKFKSIVDAHANEVIDDTVKFEPGYIRPTTSEFVDDVHGKSRDRIDHVRENDLFTDYVLKSRSDQVAATSAGSRGPADSTKEPRLGNGDPAHGGVDDSHWLPTGKIVPIVRKFCNLEHGLLPSYALTKYLNEESAKAFPAPDGIEANIDAHTRSLRRAYMQKLADNMTESDVENCIRAFKAPGEQAKGAAKSAEQISAGRPADTATEISQQEAASAVARVLNKFYQQGRLAEVRINKQGYLEIADTAGGTATPNWSKSRELAVNNYGWVRGCINVDDSWFTRDTKGHLIIKPSREQKLIEGYKGALRADQKRDPDDVLGRQPESTIEYRYTNRDITPDPRQQRALLEAESRVSASTMYSAGEMVLDSRSYQATQPPDSTQAADRPFTIEDINEMVKRHIDELNGKGKHEEAKALERVQEKLAQSPELRETATAKLTERFGRIGRTGRTAVEGVGAVATAAYVANFLLDLVGY